MASQAIIHAPAAQDPAEVHEVPVNPVNNWRQYLSVSCLTHQAKLLAHWDISLLKLGERILTMDRMLQQVWKGYANSSLLDLGVISLHMSLKEKQTMALHEVVKFLLTLPMDGESNMIKAMLQRRLGEYLLNDENPRALPLEYSVTGIDPLYPEAWFPVHYAIVHHGPDGKPGTPRQYSVILDRAIDYIDDRDGHDDSQTEDDLNAYAKKIDYAGFEQYPTLTMERDWASLTAGITAARWRNKTGGRRYAWNSWMKDGIRVFIRAFREQLSKIPEEDWDKPLPWHLLYIGWTAKFYMRRKEHFKHASGSALKNLIETIAWVEFPDEKLLMHMYPLTYVMKPLGIKGEHIISILASSYNVHGGLNTKSGGDTGAISKSPDKNSQCWLTAEKALAMQGILRRNIDSFVAQLKEDRPYIDLAAAKQRIIAGRRQLRALRQRTPVIGEVSPRAFLKWLKMTVEFRRVANHVLPEIQQKLEWIEKAKNLMVEFKKVHIAGQRQI